MRAPTVMAAAFVAAVSAAAAILGATAAFSPLKATQAITKGHSACRPGLGDRSHPGPRRCRVRKLPPVPVPKPQPIGFSARSA